MTSFYAKDIIFNLQSKAIIKKWIKEVIENSGNKVKDINIIFCSDSSILEINNQFLGHNYYTDIITFDYCNNNEISGELYISIDTVKANAIEYNQVFETELHRVIIHGILHLIGLDDHSKQDIEKMRKAENESLLLLTNIVSR
ncbi:MAG: rRNA maturation RNase YbeY [Bacteroidales bacterium]